ncbi:MAG: phage tail sheath subtilisin-like domain-containing protein [Candidatus Izemoplasma sp.]
MPFYISPSVNVLEATFVNVIPAVPTQIGAIVGNFNWGPVNDDVLLSSVTELQKVFGVVSDANAKDWWVTANYMDYSKSVRTARAINDDYKEAELEIATINVVDLSGSHIPGSGSGRTNADYTVYNITQGTTIAGTLFTLNATDLTVTAPSGEIAVNDIVIVQFELNGEAFAFNARDVASPVWDIVKQIQNTAHFSQLEPTLNADNRRTLAKVFAKYPGKFGNRIKIAYRDGKDHGADTWDAWTYSNQFDFQPTQSADRDEFAVVVLVDNVLVEKFLVDAVFGRKDGDSQDNFYINVINNNSSYILATTNIGDDFTSGSGDLFSSEAFTATGTSAAAVDTGWFDIKDSDGNNVIDAANFADYSNVRAYVDGIEFTEANFPGASVAFQNDVGDEIQVELSATGAFSGTESIVVVVQNDTMVGQALLLKSGSDGDAAASGDYITVWNDRFTNAEGVDINYPMQGGTSDLVGRHILENVAGYRKDCIGTVSPQQSTVVNVPDPVGNVVDWRRARNQFVTNHMNVSTSYGVADSNYKYQYDPYMEKYRWLPLNGDIAGLMARTSLTKDPWWSPGGYNRGQIKNVVKLAYNPDRTDRDELYINNLNPIITEAGEGTLMLGDKTLLSRPGPFDRINIRNLFIVLEKAIANMAKYELFEFNDRVTRQKFVQAVVPYLRDIQGRRGIQEDSPINGPGFNVLANEQLNTATVIDNKEFKANIMIKPQHAINFIELTFTAVGTGVSFEEVVSSVTA